MQLESQQKHTGFGADLRIYDKQHTILLEIFRAYDNNKHWIHALQYLLHSRD